MLEAIASEFVRRNLLPQHPFDLGDLIDGFFHPAGRRALARQCGTGFHRTPAEIGPDKGQEREGN